MIQPFNPWQKPFVELCEHYRVPDYVNRETKFLFLLESPHVKELHVGAPVCGSSGATMSRHLLGDAYRGVPLGRLVQAHDKARTVHGTTVASPIRSDLATADLCETDRSLIARIGLMNVCPIPMQQTAYPDASVLVTHSDLLTRLSALRLASQRALLKNPELAMLRTLIVTSLYDRLARLTDQPLTIVACGHFARTYLQLTNLQSPSWTFFADIPHPSFNNWSKSNYTAAVTRLVTAFRAAHARQG